MLFDVSIADGSFLGITISNHGITTPDGDPVGQIWVGADDAQELEESLTKILNMVQTMVDSE